MRSALYFAGIVVFLAMLNGGAFTIASLHMLGDVQGENTVSSWLGLAAFMALVLLPYVLAAGLFFAIPAMVLAYHKGWFLSRDAVILMLGGVGTVAGFILGIGTFRGLELWFPALAGLANGLIGGTLWWLLVTRRDAARARKTFNGENR